MTTEEKILEQIPVITSIGVMNKVLDSSLYNTKVRKRRIKKRKR